MWSVGKRVWRYRRGIVASACSDLIGAIGLLVYGSLSKDEG